MLTRLFDSLLCVGRERIQPRRPRKAAAVAASFAAAILCSVLALPTFAAPSWPEGVDGDIAPDGALILTLQGEAGIENAPIPDSIRDELMNDFEASGDPEEVYVLNQQIVEAIDRSIESGKVDPYLEPYLEEIAFGGGCQSETRTFSKSFSFDWDGSKTAYNPGFWGSKFQGSMEVIGDVSGTVTMDLRYKVKRKRILWVGPCVSMWVKPRDVRAYGEATVDGDLSASGNLSNTNDPWTWQWNVANVDLGTYNFSVFGIPFTAEFDLPITAGLTVQAEVAAAMDFDSNAHLSGNFDYTCQKSGCNGTSSFQVTGFGDPTLNSSITGRVQVDGFVDIAAHAELEALSVGLVKGQVGVRGVAYADFWAYYGNLCGDRDDDGSNETVGALTLDLDVQAFLNAKVDFIGSSPRNWPDLAHTSRYHLTFVDIIGSSAIEPIFHGSSEIPIGAPSNFTISMPPCWPYDDHVDYTVHWGDGTADAHTSAPDNPVQLSHTFSQAGVYSASVTVDQDAHGRGLGHSTERTLDATSLQAMLNCLHTGSEIRCDGSGLGGAAPYFPEWRVLGSSTYDPYWTDGGFTNQYQCKPGENYTVQFRIFDSGGSSAMASGSCNNGPF